MGMYMYTATYKTLDGIEVVDDIDEFYVEKAIETARRIAKRNSWKVISVKPKVYPPTPVVYQTPPQRDDFMTIR
jgi:hypothetical protein